MHGEEISNKFQKRAWVGWAKQCSPSIVKIKQLLALLCLLQLSLNKSPRNVCSIKTEALGLFESRLHGQFISPTYLQIPDLISRIAFNSNLLPQSVVDSYFDHCLKSIKRIDKNVKRSLDEVMRTVSSNYWGTRPKDVINLFVLLVESIKVNMHASLLTLIELEFWLSHKLFAVQQNKDRKR